MKPVVHILDALLEAEEAINWYENREFGLGAKFQRALKEAETFIAANPKLGQPFRNRTRKWPLRGFPHRIVYRERRDLIIVIAVAHPKRRTGYWFARLR
jgi:plasmid stabilization system protein ParE